MLANGETISTTTHTSKAAPEESRKGVSMMSMSIARRGARVALLSALLISIAGLGAATSSAAPIEGAQRRTQTRPLDGHTLLRAPDSCPTFPAFPDRTPDLFITIAGWYGPSHDNHFFEVQLTANVSGSVTDAAGNVYRVQGHFAENGTRVFPSDLQFRGEGTLVIAGPAGVYTGRATASHVLAPTETALSFTEMAACQTR